MKLYCIFTTVLLIVTISFVTNGTPLTEQDEMQLRDEVLSDFINFEENGVISERLFSVMQQIPFSSVFSVFPSFSNVITYDGTICIACRSVVDALYNYQKSHNKQEVRDLVYSMCTELQLQNEEVCGGVIDLNMDSLLYIFNHSQGDISSRFCGILLQTSDCSRDDPSLEWTVDVDLGKKPPVNKNSQGTSAKADPLTIIQLTDIHHDPTYLVEGNAVCGEPMCCRSYQGKPITPEAAAGYWGDYRSCDTSWHALEDTLQQIKNEHKQIDYIYMTGDIVDHAVWNTSKKQNTDSITSVLGLIKNVFPNTQVYPVLGNHEPSPLNVYAPHNITDESISVLWLYELVADLWSTWLPAETKDTIMKGGYYTALARPGFRIIGMNNNVCYTFNWWLAYSPKDQDDQLKWLAETLLQAEKDGEKVHILGHIPSGDSSCQRTWSREFHKIIDRFESTVASQFNGHTHNDHFHVHYAKDDPTRATNVAFNGGSVTPFSDLNSNYKLYSMDSSSYNILDIDTWIFNMTDANKHGNATPNWEKLYSFKEKYGTDSMSPTDLDKLTHKMASNRSLLELYAKNFVKFADPALAAGCDNACLKDKLCYMATTEFGDNTQCNALMQEFDTANGGGGYIETVGNYLKPIWGGR